MPQTPDRRPRSGRTACGARALVIGLALGLAGCGGGRVVQLERGTAMHSELAMAVYPARPLPVVIRNAPPGTDLAGILAVLPTGLGARVSYVLADRPATAYPYAIVLDFDYSGATALTCNDPPPVPSRPWPGQIAAAFCRLGSELSADLGYYSGRPDAGDPGFARMLQDAVITLFDSETGHGFLPARLRQAPALPPARQGPDWRGNA